jgi:hypothetical protein
VGHFTGVERNVTDLQSLFLVLAERYGKYAFDAGKKCVPEQDAEFVALLGPHSEGLTKRMENRWLAGWNNASARPASATVTGHFTYRHHQHHNVTEPAE